MLKSRLNTAKNKINLLNNMSSENMQPEAPRGKTPERTEQTGRDTQDTNL